MYCNNNHLKLIDMKTFNLLVEIQDLGIYNKSFIFVL
nr:MAG TPA: hypothetical protein [Microviridae sp.]